MFQKWFREHKIKFILILLSFLCIVIAYIIYTLYGHQLIRAMYEGTSIGYLNRIIEVKASFPVEHYFKIADIMFFSYSIIFFMGIFFLIFFNKSLNILFYGIVAIYIVYCISFIINASFVINGVRYFTLFDDPMIGMKYAKNLAEGYGLLWNPGEPAVEGYTHFLWTIYMAFWHLFPIAQAKISLIIQISGMIFLVCSLFLIKKVAYDVSERPRYTVIAAILLTASYLPINFWGLRGWETSVLGFIVLLAIWRVFRCLESKNFDPLLFVILAIGMLVRVDFAVLFVTISIFIILAIPKNQNKNMFWATCIFLLILVAHTLFRLSYYNDILPNTYYLKVAGIPFHFRVLRGLSMAVLFTNKMSLFLFALPFVYGIFRIRNKKICFLLYLFLIQLFYSIYVGGDAWEGGRHLANRYLCIVMPAFFILISLAISDFIQSWSKSLNRSVYLKKCCFIFLLVFIFIQLHGGLKSPMFRELISFSGIHVEHDKQIVNKGLILKRITSPNAKIAVVWAGAIPYFSNRNCIDMLGRSDKVIAYKKARIKDYADFYPGHNKYDYSYSIGELKPDIVAQLWLEKKEALMYLQKDYKTVSIDGWDIYVRKNSPNIKWAEIEKLASPVLGATFYR